jgi:hypothetical protein
VLPNHPPGVEIRKEIDMHRITTLIRVPALERTVWILDRTLAACVRHLDVADANPPDALLQGERTVEHADTATERLIVLQVLERSGQRSRAELEIALSDIEPLAICEALRALEAEAVLYTLGEQVLASGCVQHLDRLGFISL